MKLTTRAKLSLLWIMILFNMVFADILSLYIPGIHKELASFAGDTPIAQLMLIGAIIHQIPIFMILLSQVLSYKMSRWLNIAASLFTIAYVVGGGSFLPHYLFIAAIEVMLMLYIIYTAWKWSE